MDSIGFWNALQDPIPLGNLLDDLVEDWHGQLSETVDEIAPQHLFITIPNQRVTEDKMGTMMASKCGSILVTELQGDPIGDL